MESSGKIKLILLLLALFFTSCTTTVVKPAVLAELKPLPSQGVTKVKEYEPVYAVMKILEISEENGVQKYLVAKSDPEVTEDAKNLVGEISGDIEFSQILGTYKITSISSNFIRGTILSTTHKIPSNSYVRIQIGEKLKEEE